MLEDLSSKDKVVGLKQVRRAIVCGRAGHVFLARDADPVSYTHLTLPTIRLV